MNGQWDVRHYLIKHAHFHYHVNGNLKNNKPNTQFKIFCLSLFCSMFCCNTLFFFFSSLFVAFFFFCSFNFLFDRSIELDCCFYYFWREIENKICDSNAFQAIWSQMLPRAFEEIYMKIHSINIGIEIDFAWKWFGHYSAIAWTARSQKKRFTFMYERSIVWCTHDLLTWNIQKCTWKYVFRFKLKLHSFHHFEFWILFRTQKISLRQHIQRYTNTNTNTDTDTDWLCLWFLACIFLWWNLINYRFAFVHVLKIKFFEKIKNSPLIVFLFVQSNHTPVT